MTMISFPVQQPVKKEISQWQNQETDQGTTTLTFDMMTAAIYKKH